MKSVSLINAAARPGTDTAARAAVSLTPAPRWDPRLYQIATLAGLLGYGVFWLDLEVQTPTAVAIVVTALVAQLACTRLTARGRFDPRSALISALSLCLLLRTGSLGLAILAAGLARGPRALRHAGGPRGLRGPVQAVQDQRPAVVARRLLAARPAHRPGAARLTLPMEALAMKHVTALLAALLVVALATPTVLAFCGFYVAKADTKLFNQASQVVLVRHDDKTVLTMANDFRGDLKEFAIVVPVPTVLDKGQIRVSDRALIEHLDAYSAPRLVEYFDDDPCSPRYPATLQAPRGMTATRGDAAAERARGLGVTIEARYTVGEYDILILSARESGGRGTWLRGNGYRVPAGPSSTLGSYLKQGMKFFVARVNLKEQARLGFTYLRPL